MKKREKLLIKILMTICIILTVDSKYHKEIKDLATHISVERFDDD